MTALCHLPYPIFQHMLDFVAHGLRAGLAGMNPHDICGTVFYTILWYSAAFLSKGYTARIIADLPIFLSLFVNGR